MTTRPTELEAKSGAAPLPRGDEAATLTSSLPSDAPTWVPLSIRGNAAAEEMYRRTHELVRARCAEAAALRSRVDELEARLAVQSKAFRHHTEKTREFRDQATAAEARVDELERALGASALATEIAVEGWDNGHLVAAHRLALDVLTSDFRKTARETLERARALSFSGGERPPLRDEEGR